RARCWWIGPRTSDTTHAYRSRDIVSGADSACAEVRRVGPGSGARSRLGGLRRPEGADAGCAPHGGRPALRRGAGGGVEAGGRAVRDVLEGGHHADMQRWGLKQAGARTWMRRPDLIARGGLPADAANLLDEFLAEREGDRDG